MAARTCHTSPSLTFLSSIHRDGPPNPIEKLHIVRTFNVPTKVYHTYIAIFFHSRSILTALLLHLPSNLAFNWISPRPICCSSTEQKTLQQYCLFLKCLVTKQTLWNHVTSPGRKRKQDLKRQRSSKTWQKCNSWRLLKNTLLSRSRNVDQVMLPVFCAISWCSKQIHYVDKHITLQQLLPTSLSRYHPQSFTYLMVKTFMEFQQIHWSSSHRPFIAHL